MKYNYFKREDVIHEQSKAKWFHINRTDDCYSYHRHSCGCRAACLSELTLTKLSTVKSFSLPALSRRQLKSVRKSKVTYRMCEHSEGGVPAAGGAYGNVTSTTWAATSRYSRNPYSGSSRLWRCCGRRYIRSDRGASKWHS